MYKYVKYRRLNLQEELHHVKLWRENNDKESYELLIESLYPYVRNFIYKLVPTEMKRDMQRIDSMAWMACIETVRRHDVTKGARLITFSKFPAMAEIANAKKEDHPIHVNNDTIRNVMRNKTPHLTNAVLTAARIKREYNRNGISTQPFVDHNRPDKIVERKETITLVRNLINKLPKEQKIVITGRYIDGKLSKTIAEELGTSPFRIQRILYKAMQSMKRMVNATK